MYAVILLVLVAYKSLLSKKYQKSMYCLLRLGKLFARFVDKLLVSAQKIR